MIGFCGGVFAETGQTTAMSNYKPLTANCIFITFAPSNSE